MLTIEAESADQAWLAAADLFRTGEARSQPSRVAPTRELLHVAITVADPSQRWVGSREPAMNPAFALAEVVWILGGRRDSGFMNFWNPALPSFAGPGETYHGAYGYRLRAHLGVDQIDRAVKALRANPDGRQVVLQIWDSRVDLPSEDGQPVDPDVPCNLLSTLKVRGGQLEWLQVIRSNDLFLGVPHNFVQFTMLQEIVAGWIGVEVGSYNHISDSLHVYERDLPSVLKSRPLELPKSEQSRLAYPREESERAIAEIENRATEMTREDLSSARLEQLVEEFAAPEAYRNWLLVLGAEAARRRGWRSLGQEILDACSDPLLRELWIRWRTRVGERTSEEVAS